MSIRPPLAPSAHSERLSERPTLPTPQPARSSQQQQQARPIVAEAVTSTTQPHRTTTTRARVYAAAPAARPEPASRRSTRRNDPIIESLRAAVAAASSGVQLPAPDFDALGQQLSVAADQYLRSLNGRIVAHWLFTATVDLAKRLSQRDLAGAAAALESAHLALRFAHTRVSDAPDLWRVLAEIACALAAR